MFSKIRKTLGGKGKKEEDEEGVGEIVDEKDFGADLDDDELDVSFPKLPVKAAAQEPSGLKHEEGAGDSSAAPSSKSSKKEKKQKKDQKEETEKRKSKRMSKKDKSKSKDLRPTSMAPTKTPSPYSNARPEDGGFVAALVAVPHPTSVVEAEQSTPSTTEASSEEKDSKEPAVVGPTESAVSSTEPALGSDDSSAFPSAAAIIASSSAPAVAQTTHSTAPSFLSWFSRSSSPPPSVEPTSPPTSDSTIETTQKSTDEPNPLSSDSLPPLPPKPTPNSSETPTSATSTFGSWFGSKSNPAVPVSPPAEETPATETEASAAPETKEATPTTGRSWFRGKEVKVGELYVMVMRAEDLKTPTADTQLFVNVSHHRMSQRSENVPTTAVPTFYEEFVFSVTDKKEPLTVELLSAGKFKNDSLGVAKIDLGSLPNGNLVEDWYVMEKASWFSFKKKDEKGPEPIGRMHLRVRFTEDRASPLLTLPMPPLEKPVVNTSLRLPSIRMVLERHTYFPGDTIHGYLFINVHDRFLALNMQKPLMLKGIKIRFHGSTKSRWPKDELSWYSAKLAFFDETITLFGYELSQNKEVVLSSGMYKWPFSYKIPSFVPPSHWYKELETYAINQYFVRLYLDAVKEEDSLVLNQYLRVMEQYNCPADQEFLLGAAEKAQALLRVQDVALVVNVPPAIYAGEPLPVKLVVVNNADRAVTSFEYELWMEVVFHSDSHRRVQPQVGETFKFHRKKSLEPWVELIQKGPFAVEGTPIPAGESWSGIATSIVLPKTLEPSLPESISPLVTRTYKLKITAWTDGNIFTYGKMDTNFNVLVGHRREVALSLPEQYVGNLQSLTSAQLHPEDSDSLFLLFADSPSIEPSKLIPTPAE